MIFICVELLIKYHKWYTNLILLNLIDLNLVDNFNIVGVVNFDKKSGYWLVHSLPRFPNNESYAWPPSGRKYGQTFLCISMPYSQLDVIGEFRVQLQLSKIYVPF